MQDTLESSRSAFVGKYPGSNLELINRSAGAGWRIASSAIRFGLITAAREGTESHSDAHSAPARRARSPILWAQIKRPVILSPQFRTKDRGISSYPGAPRCGAMNGAARPASFGQCRGPSSWRTGLRMTGWFVGWFDSAIVPIIGKSEQGSADFRLSESLRLSPPTTSDSEL